MFTMNCEVYYRLFERFRRRRFRLDAFKRSSCQRYLWTISWLQITLQYTCYTLVFPFSFFTDFSITSRRRICACGVIIIRLIIVNRTIVNCNCYWCTNILTFCRFCTFYCCQCFFGNDIASKNRSICQRGMNVVTCVEYVRGVEFELMSWRWRTCLLLQITNTAALCTASWGNS